MGIALLAETNTHWPSLPEGQNWNDRMRQVGSQGYYSVTAHNENRARPIASCSQYGGCVATLLNSVAHRAKSVGRDPTKLGRWAYVRIQGKKFAMPSSDSRVNEANKKLKEASKRLMAQWRVQYLDKKKKDVASDFRKSKTRYNRERQLNLHRMKQKEEARRRRRARGKGFSGGLQLIQVDRRHADGTVTEVTLSHRPGVEAGCMAENSARYDQTRFPYPTPPMKPPLYQDFTSSMAEDHMQELLHGEYAISSSLDHPTHSFLDHCRIPDGLCPMNLTVTQEDHNKFWKRMPENKGSEPHGLHNGHFKAATFSALLSLCDSVSRDIPLKTGMAPKNWLHLMNFAIEKKPGDFRVKAMRTIQMMVAESQANNKLCGRSAMQYGEANGLVPDGQFGSRKKHQAIDLALAKALLWDQLAMRRLAAG